MTIFNRKYRIVKDCYAGYEVQFRFWFGFIWHQCGTSVNTHRTLEDAKLYLKSRKDRGEVVYLD